MESRSVCDQQGNENESNAPGTAIAERLITGQDCTLIVMTTKKDVAEPIHHDEVNYFLSFGKVHEVDLAIVFNVMEDYDTIGKFIPYETYYFQDIEPNGFCSKSHSQKYQTYVFKSEPCEEEENIVG